MTDFDKACDLVEWELLDVVLAREGSRVNLRKWRLSV